MKTERKQNSQVLKIYKSIATVDPLVTRQEVVSMTQNQIAYWALQETKRSNAAKEAETNRTNVANEQIKSKQQKAQEERWKTQSVLEGIKTGFDIVNGVGGAVSALAAFI